MIFLDSNIPMYLVGAPHELKGAAQRILERCAIDRVRLVTDAEVFQEILHRYTAINRREAIQPAFDALLSLVDEVFLIELADVERAKAILLQSSRLSARDALHIAVMEHQGVNEIMSFDRGFDDFEGVKRIYATN